MRAYLRLRAWRCCWARRCPCQWRRCLLHELALLLQARGAGWVQLLELALVPALLRGPAAAWAEAGEEVDTGAAQQEQLASAAEGAAHSPQVARR